MCLGRVSSTFRVQAARWQPRPWMGHVLHLRCWRLLCCLCAIQPGRGPKHPDGRLLAELPRGSPATLLMQIARDGDPRTPRGRWTHHSLGPGPLLSPSGKFAPVLFPAASAMSVAAAIRRWRGMDLQGFDNTRSAVRTSCATDRGKAACWWPNPGLSSALCLPARALALCCPVAWCRLPAGSRDPAAG